MDSDTPSPHLYSVRDMRVVSKEDVNAIVQSGTGKPTRSLRGNIGIFVPSMEAEHNEINVPTDLPHRGEDLRSICRRHPALPLITTPVHDIGHCKERTTESPHGHDCGAVESCRIDSSSCMCHACTIQKRKGLTQCAQPEIQRVVVGRGNDGDAGPLECTCRRGRSGENHIASRILRPSMLLRYVGFEVRENNVVR